MRARPGRNLPVLTRLPRDLRLAPMDAARLYRTLCGTAVVEFPHH